MLLPDQTVHEVLEKPGTGTDQMKREAKGLTRGVPECGGPIQSMCRIWGMKMSTGHTLVLPAADSTIHELHLRSGLGHRKGMRRNRSDVKPAGKYLSARSPSAARPVTRPTVR